MCRCILSLFVLVATAVTAGAGEPQGKLILEHWDTAFLEGGRAGYVHTTVHQFDRDGQKLLRTTVNLHLTVQRSQDIIALQGTTGTEETSAGKVVGTFMTQQVGKNKKLTITGRVKGKQIELLLDGKSGVLKPAPWDDRAVGMYRQQVMFQDKQLQAGDKFSYLSFEPTVNLVLRTDVTVKGYQEVDILGSKNKVKLLRVEIAPEKLDQVKLPTLTVYLDAAGKPVRQDVDAPGLGQMTLFRTPGEVALAPVHPAATFDITQFVRLSNKLVQPYDLSSVTYRITVKGEEDASTSFSRDDRQQVKEAKGATFVLQVKAKRGPGKAIVADKVADEFTQSSYFINSADPKVKDLARLAANGEKDPWKKALLIEKWVHLNVRGTPYQALAPADEVARVLEGDCTEFAMLMAAMCRAEGIPARTAIGLIYADVKVGPVMAFHMWTEVWVENQWVPLDATLGRGFVGATHLKITDHSWHETRSLVPLLPLIRVLGKVQIEVVSSGQ